MNDSRYEKQNKVYTPQTKLTSLHLKMGLHGKGILLENGPFFRFHVVSFPAANPGGM